MRFTRDNLIVLAGVVGITTTYFAVIYRWQKAELDGARIQAAEGSRRLRADGVEVARVAPMVREIEAMKRRFNKDWDRRLPERDELAGFLREISSSLAAEKLSDPAIRPGNPTRGPLYNCLPITMTFEGNFLALAEFLRRVDGMTRLTRIESMTIKPARGQDKAGGLAVELGMNIYFTEH